MSRKPTKSNRKPLKTLKLTPRESDDGQEPPFKKHCVGFTLSKPPLFDLTRDDAITSSSSQSLHSKRLVGPTPQPQRTMVDVKGKGRETKALEDDEDSILWVDKYEPTVEAELAVHKRKVDDIRHWLLEAFGSGPSAKLRKYRRILVLTGPAGTAKTATVRVLSRELGFEIVEWRNSTSHRGQSMFAGDEPRLDEELDLDTETLFDKFQSFLTRAMTCNSVFRPSYPQIQPSTWQPSIRQAVLLEDLPNLLHQPTQARFQALLRSLCIPTSNMSQHPGPPIVIIVSDSGLRAEQPDNDTWNGGNNGWRWDRKEVLDIRNILGPDLLTSPYVTRIGFNPIAPTLMVKALQALLVSHYGSLAANGRTSKQPSREIVDVIAGSSNGDIRSAIMALQFACVVDLPSSLMKSKSKVAHRDIGTVTKAANARAVFEAVTRREQSLVLFHLMGKILYNKRKFDPPASRLSTKDAAKERELDMQLVDPLPLPDWLSHHDRKASRVCIETLAAESPIDSSLLGLYIQQNYTQFCTDIDQCDGVCDGLSWADCISGVQLTNSPFAFPTMTLSTLHSLPTPVARSRQKVCKPAWFDVHTRELGAMDAVGDVLGWLGKGANTGHQTDADTPPISVGKWTYANITTELGGLLRALDRCSSRPQEGPYRLPQTHRLFSHLPWSLETPHGGDSTLEENEDGEFDKGGDGDEDVRLPGGIQNQEERKGWLEDDDIEDTE